MKVDDTTYIDLSTGEITDNPEGYLHCDTLIAPTLSVLNTKGYKTSASCSGHSQKLAISHRGVYKIVPNKPLEEQIKELLYLMYQQGKTIIINRIDTKNIYFEFITDTICVYVAFNMDYNFKTLPQGFRLLRYDKGISISKNISRKRPNGTNKSESELYKEIIQSNKELLRWANTLEIHKEIRLWKTN
ncbi:MAG: hypothetical protein IKQ29_02750 [Bacilli bacterium]|nr:hypothetical protein [Bacilli bacterium]